MKITVTEYKSDPYDKLYSMSKAELIKIIKDCDAVIAKH